MAQENNSHHSVGADGLMACGSVAQVDKSHHCEGADGLMACGSVAQVNKSHHSEGRDGLMAGKTAPGKGITSIGASFPLSAVNSRNHFDEARLRDDQGEEGEAVLEGAQQGTGTAGVCQSGSGLVI